MSVIPSFKLIPYQSFLIAIFFGLSIYAPNRTYFSVQVMFLPMSILIILIGLALIILNYAHLDLNRGQIFISCFLLLNFGYFPVNDFLQARWTSTAALNILFTMLSILLFFAIWRISSAHADNLCRIMNVIAIFLIVISMANLGFAFVFDSKEINDNQGNFEAQFQHYLAKNLTSAMNTRDFYFIILDRYPGQDILSAEYEFDNSDYIDNLKAMGFTVLDHSKSNYGVTGWSLPSMLNMDYFESAENAGYNDEFNRLWKFFKSQGFIFIFLPSNWGDTISNANADIVLNPYLLPIDSSSSVFQEIMFFERTFLGMVYQVAQKFLLSPEVSISSYTSPDQYIRHCNLLGELTSINLSSSSDKQDSTFKKVAGLADGRYVSFESVNFPGYYLRHQDLRLKLQKQTTDSDLLFKEDATFKVVSGLADTNAVSFESYNFPGYYMRDNKSHMYIEPAAFDNVSFKKDATFWIVSPNYHPANLDSIEALQQRIRDGKMESFNERNDGSNDASGSHVLYTFENLTHVPNITRKKFVFAHIQGWENIAGDSSYTDRIKATNEKVVSTINQIISQSNPDPIIVLISDHGIKPSVTAVLKNRSVYAKYAHYQNNSLDQESITTSWYTLNNFAAYYLPDGGDKRIYLGMTPVNMWRTILNYYFRTDFPLMEDRSYWYSGGRMYEIS